MRKNGLVDVVKKIKAEETLLQKQIDDLRKKEIDEIMQAAKALVGREFTISEPRTRRCHGKFSYRIVAVHYVSRDWDNNAVLHYSAELLTRCKNFNRPSVSRRVGTVYRKQISLNRVGLLKFK